MARKLSKKKVKSVAPKLSSTKMTNKSNAKRKSTSTPTGTKSAATKKVEKQNVPDSSPRTTRSKRVQSSQTSVHSDSSLISKTLKIEIKRINEKPPLGSKRSHHQNLKSESETVPSKRKHVSERIKQMEIKSTPKKPLRKENPRRTSRNLKIEKKSPTKKSLESMDEDEDEDANDQENGTTEDDNSDADFKINSRSNSAKSAKKKTSKKGSTPKKRKSKPAKKDKKVNLKNNQSADAECNNNNNNADDDHISNEHIKDTELMLNPENGTGQSDGNKPSLNRNNLGSSNQNPLFNRKYFFNPNMPTDDTKEESETSQIKDSTQSDDKHSFTVASYNILADCHAKRDYTNSPWITAQELSIESRHERIMEEVKFLNADVFCFQEVGTEYFRDVLKTSMMKLGYEGLYVPRQWKEKPYEEGEATFYKTSVFELKAHQNLLLEEFAKKEIDDIKYISSEVTKQSMKQSVESYAVSLLTYLKTVSGQLTVCVANVHICYDEFLRQDKQCLQIAATIRELQRLSSTEGNKQPNDNHNNNNDDDDDLLEQDVPQIICGDFNSWPTSAPQRLIRDGRLNEEDAKMMMDIMSVNLDGGEVTSLFSQWNDAFHFDPSPCYQSAYQVVMGSDPYTSRFNMDGEVRQVDFIYYSSDMLIPKKVLGVLDKSEIQDGVPNSLYPSDHVSIMAEFSLII